MAKNPRGDNVADHEQLALAAHLKKKGYDTAILCAKKSLAIARKCKDKESEKKLYITLLNFHFKKREYNEAISYGKKCLDIAQEQGDEEAEIEAYFKLGMVHKCKKEYDDAIIYAQKCIEMANKYPNGLNETRSCIMLGKNYFYKEEYDNALSYCKKGLEMANNLRGDRVAEQLAAYKVLGDVYLKIDDHDAAISCLQKYLVIQQGLGIEITELKIYIVFGQAHFLKKQYDDALTYSKKAVELANKYCDKLSEMYASFILGRIYLEKEEYDSSYTYFAQSMDIAKGLDKTSAIELLRVWICYIFEAVGLNEEQPSANDPFSARSPKKNHWSILYQKYLSCRREGKYMIAIEFLEAVIQAGVGTRGNGALETAPDALRLNIYIAEMYEELGQYNESRKYFKEALVSAREKIYTQHAQACCHFGLGKIHYKHGELEHAEISFKESFRCLEHICHHLGQNDRFKIAIFDKYKENYQMLFKVFIDLEKKEEALCLLDNSRGRALKDLLNYGMKESKSTKRESDTRETDKGLRYADVQALVSSGGYSLLVYSTCTGQLYEFVVETGRELGFTVKQIQKCVDEHVEELLKEIEVTATVNYENTEIEIIEEEIKDTNPKDQFTQLLMRRKDKLSEQCCPLRCNDRGFPSENTDIMSITNLEKLYLMLIKGVESFINKDEIVIIPEGPLYKVPFAALRDPDTGKYLSEWKRIRLAPSMTTLKLIKENPVDHHYKRNALIIGDPLVGEVMVNGKSKTLPPLEGAREEADDISLILNEDPLCGEKANKPAVLEKLQQGASIVHIAAHGHLSKATIMLAPSPEIRAKKKIPDEEDYMLTMAEVHQAQVHAQLVVLSLFQWMW